MARGDAPSRDVEGGPVCLPGHAPFVADPAAAGTAVGEDDAVRIDVQDRPVDGRPVETAGVVAVEPEFRHRRIAGHQVPDRPLVGGLIFPCRSARRLDHAVPGREVDAHGDPVAAAGLPQSLQDVRMVEAAGIGDVRRALRVVPEAESVVVLGRDDDAAEAVLRSHPDPLIRVHGVGAVVLQEQVFGPPVDPDRRRAVRPVVAGKRRLPEMVEHQHLLLLPGQLGLGRESAVRCGRTGAPRHQ